MSSRTADSPTRRPAPVAPDGPTRRRPPGWALRVLAVGLVLCAGVAVGALWLAPLAGPSPARAQSAETDVPGANVPRMASLRADEVNVRAGPGTRFRIKWVFRREGMPIRITAEYDTWRKIRDWEGAEGWIHRAMLSGRQTVLVTRPESTMRRLPETTAPAVARLAEGMVARLEGCEDGWCHVETRGYEGWVRRDDLWGVGG